MEFILIPDLILLD